jgi:DMSO reductase family type II enzyme heme b subunit
MNDIAPSTRRDFRIRASNLLLLVTITILVPFAGRALGAPDATAPPVAKSAPDDPGENPLRAVDEATRRQALTDAWQTYQTSCRPCHGSVGNGDGPYAHVSELRATDLRRAGKAAAPDAVRYRRIRDGAAGLSEDRWNSAMPAFGDDLEPRQIWGLVLLLEELAKPMTGFAPTTDVSEVYASRCAVCHGSKGAGDGPLAAELRPRPRNFVRAEYRMRSTAYGHPPIDSDVIGSVAHGFADTPMGAFSSLGMQPLEDLYPLLRDFTAEPFTGEPTVVLGSRTPSLPSDQLAARGRGVYEQAKCADCHGVSGRGNGPMAAKLANDDGTPTLASNLTKRWQAKSGGTAQTLFKVVSAGMNGTPMRGYDTLSGDDRWALAYYLEGLGRTRRKPTPVFARNVSGDLPTDPTSDTWKSIPLSFVSLGPQMERRPYWSQPAVDLVEVAAAVNEHQIAIFLLWDDRTHDIQNADAGTERTLAATLARRDWRLPDQVAVQMPIAVRDATLPMPYLGDAKHPVERWRWSADRSEAGQHDASVERFAGPEDGPKPPAAGSAVRTAASFVDGQWRVLFIADRPKLAGKSLPIAVQAWDGSSGESGTWQSFSSWLEITLP